MIQFQYNDGGRLKAGFSGDTRDCVTRALAIALDRPYAEVYDEVFEMVGHSPRKGIERKKVYALMEYYGFEWVPTMFVGQGCKVHLRGDELPSGRIICNLSKHVAAVIDGVLHDNHDSSRNGKRCVYGYWKKKVDMAA